MKVLILLTLALNLVTDHPAASQVAKPVTTPEQRFFDWTTLQFSKEVYQKRRSDLIESLQNSGGGVYVTPSHQGRSHGFSFRQLNDFLYFTGLELPGSILVIDSDMAESMLFVPKRDARFESARRPNDFPGRPLSDDPELGRVSGFEDIRPSHHFKELLTHWISKRRVLRINPGHPGDIQPLSTGLIYDWNAVEEMSFHLQQTYPTAILKSAFREIAQQRMVKGPEEVEAIRRVCSLTVEAIKHSVTFVKDGVYERTLEAELEAANKRGGAQRLAFASIIKSGPNSLWPWRILAAHYDRRNRPMKNGELVIFDVGTELDYYVSDVGRTFPVSGKFTAAQKTILEMEVAVSDAIIAAIRPGITLLELKELAISNIPPQHRKYMQTGGFFGHHIGLATGDPSLINAPLAVGMVFTVEPWYYNHDNTIAVFTEDVILVTETGAENLTNALPRTPEGLEELMQK